MHSLFISGMDLLGAAATPPPLALARGVQGLGVLFFMIKQKRQNEIQ